jgi:hypothetical protein
MIAVDAIDEMLVDEPFPMSAHPEEHRLCNVLLLGSRPNDTLRFNDALHEPAVASESLIEWVMVVLKVRLLHGLSHSWVG